MNWILIGILAGSLITSTHDTREQCEGRAVILREQKAVVKCVEAPKSYTTSTLQLSPSTCCSAMTCGPC